MPQNNVCENISGYWHTVTVNCLGRRVKQCWPWLVLEWVTVLVSVDSLLDETLNRSPLALLYRRHYEFPSGINIVQFLSISWS